MICNAACCLLVQACVVALARRQCDAKCAYRVWLQLAEEDELMWDDGTATPEPCLDRFDLVTKVIIAQSAERVGQSSSLSNAPLLCKGFE